MSQPQPAPVLTGKTVPTGRRQTAAVLAAKSSLFASIPAVLKRHWLASALITIGLVLRALVMMAYHPAILYIDSLKYLYSYWPGSDPIAYKIPLKLILAFGDLGTVAFVQHLLGIAMAIALYAVLVRRGAPRWLGSLAIAPVLFDAYQLQAEAMIMPDVWFEVMVVAGLVVLLWNPAPSLRVLIIAGALLGLSTGMRQAGEILILPALVYVLVIWGGWRLALRNAIAVTVAFALAVVLYMGMSYGLTKHFWISESSISLTYGRMASVADCATLSLPADEKPLCPTKAQQAMGPDWLDHNGLSPLHTYSLTETLPAGMKGGTNGPLVTRFNRAVELQQPLRVISGILGDSVKLFALTRHTRPGDTPIWRWEFQGNFPTYNPYIFIKHNRIWILVPPLSSGKTMMLKPSYGGPPQVDASIANFLRDYQLKGGYTPGPLLALFMVTGLIGCLLIFARRRIGQAGRGVAQACALFFATAVALLAISDLFEFTWRYQLPALVTLPPAGVLGIGLIITAIRKPRAQVPAESVPSREPELAAPAQ
jgi:hypothetical protein